MAEQLEAEVGGTYTVTLVVADGTTGLSPTAETFSGGVSVDGPFALTDQGGGLYNTTRSAPAAGDYSGLIVAGVGFERSSYNLRVRDPVADQVWDASRSAHAVVGSFGEALIAAAGHAGMHVRLDGGAGFANIQDDGDNNLTSARARIFATAAAEAAATNGAADGADGELVRLNVNVATYAAGNQTPTIRRLLNMSRSSA